MSKWTICDIEAQIYHKCYDNTFVGTIHLKLLTFSKCCSISPKCTYPTAVLTSTFTFSPPPLMEISLSAQREAQMDAEGLDQYQRSFC